jgi:DNA-binding SARP family transcriptional activator/tetratricopeptide (TPR) repeat protein
MNEPYRDIYANVGFPRDRRSPQPAASGLTWANLSAVTVRKPRDTVCPPGLSGSVSKWGDAVRFGVLGPLQVITGDAVEPEPGLTSRLRTLLAVLLWRPNQPMPVDELAELVWDGAPPSGTREATRALVMRLRKRLDNDVAVRIVTRAPGYVIELSAGELDAASFETLTQDAGAAVRADQWPQAARAAAQALGLWRGVALADVGSQLLRDQWVPHLDRLRMQALDWRIEADLHEGRHGQLIPELRDATARHPLHERFHGQLMLALVRSGQQAEALAVYEQARSMLDRELGVGPGAELRRLHERILAQDASLISAPASIPATGPAATPVEPVAPGPGLANTGTALGVPRQLPAAVTSFTGRADELTVLNQLLVQAGAGSPGMVVISAIGGTPGVGKTSLAIQWAHQVAARFPDGQFYTNLRGFDRVDAPVTPAEAIGEFLDALGVTPEQIPRSLDAQAGLYRSLLSGKRALIVLDNARDEDQVRPLLPGSPGCVVLITSRNQFTGLAASNGASLISLDILTAAEARQLLIARLGTSRAAAEPAAVADIADLCGYLPLALAVVAARAAARPKLPLPILAAELRGAGRGTAHEAGRLDALEVADATASVRTVFSWSYQQLSPAAAGLFRLLGLHPGPEITAAAAASLAACDITDARRALTELAGAHLLTERVPDRYLCHDLLHAYAGDLAAATDSAPDRQAATSRLLDYYLYTAHAAALAITPARKPLALPPPRPGAIAEQHADDRQAMAWMDAEQDVLVATAALAAEAGAPHTWQIPWTMTEFLDRRGRWNETTAILHNALAAAIKLGDATGQVTTHHRIAFACARLEHYDHARTHLTASVRICQQVGDQAGEARAYQTLSYIADRQGQHGDALSHGEQALRIFEATGNLGSQVVSLNDIGWCHAQLGDYQQAESFCQRALGLWRQLGDLKGEAHTWDTLGYIAHQQGRPAQAVGHYHRALSLFTELNIPLMEGEILTHIGDAHRAARDLPSARLTWHRALLIYDELGHPSADKVRAKLAAVDELDDSHNPKAMQTTAMRSS